MNILKQLIMKSNYCHFVSIKNNKILFNNIATYKKIEVVLELVDLLDKNSINYILDEEFNILVS